MYKILNKNQDSTEIMLYSLVYQGYTANQVIEQLRESQAENITLRINSDGGEVFEAIALYNYLKDKNVTVIVDGICASAASVIAMCGKKIVMKTGSMMMIHNPLTFAIGNAEEIREQAEILDKISGLIADIYCTRGLDREKAVKLMNDSVWLNAEETLSLGLADEIENTPEQEQETDQPESEPKSEPEIEDRLTQSYEAGVKAERERLQALDELSAPGREKYLDSAKYETYQTAEQIALDLLKKESAGRPQARTERPRDKIVVASSGEVKRGLLLMTGNGGFVPATEAGISSAEELCILADTLEIPEGNTALAYGYFTGTFNAKELILGFEGEEDNHEDVIEVIRSVLRKRGIYLK